MENRLPDLRDNLLFLMGLLKMVVVDEDDDKRDQ
jgi:hypothetical protein